MKYRITVTYRKGGRIGAYSYVEEIQKPFCDGIIFKPAVKASGIAWDVVLSISIVAEPPANTERG